MSQVDTVEPGTFASLAKLTIDRPGLEKIFCSIDFLNFCEYFVIMRPYLSPYQIVNFFSIEATTTLTHRAIIIICDLFKHEYEQKR